MLNLFALKTCFVSLQLFSGQDVAVISNAQEIPKIYACPRCRRALPKGPKKRPDPRYVPGAKHENQ